MPQSQPPSFFSLNGRARRRTYGLRVLALAVPLAFVLTAVRSSGEPEALAFAALLQLGAALSLLPSAVQRLHDLNKSGHWLWLSLVPLANLALGLVLLFARGTDGSNRYGPDPRTSPASKEKDGSDPSLPTAPAVPAEPTAELLSAADESPAAPPPAEAFTTPRGERPPAEPVPAVPVEAVELPTQPERSAPPDKPVQSGEPEKRSPSAPAGPAPVAAGLRVLYHPERAKAQQEYFPKWSLPRAGAPVQPHRIGKRGRKGYKEADFAATIEVMFGDAFTVYTDAVLAVSAGTRAYEPDIVLHDPALNLYLDIEIDEPYDGYLRRPIHCAGDDDARDEQFGRRGWMVLRFAEIQVHQTPLKCCALIAKLLHTVHPEYAIPEHLAGSKGPQRVEPWDVLQAQKWAAARYRETYLGIESFGEQAAGEPTVVDALTDEEQAVAGQDAPSQDASSLATTPQAPSSQSVPSFPPQEGRSSPLARKHAHPRDQHITFDKEAHRYYIRGNPDTISVTTLIERHFPVFDAPSVAAKVVGNPGSSYFGLDPDEVVQKWKDDGDRAAKEGEQLHEQIEAHLNGLPVETPRPEFAYFLQFLRDHPDLRIFRTEWRIYDERLMIAGTVDALFRRPDGTFVMYDWKRSKEIKKANPYQSGLGPLSHLPSTNYSTYSLQQNVYRAILEQHYGIGVAEMNLLVLHPNGGRYQKHSVEPMHRETRIILG